jgi:hypothetical protein
MASVAHYVWRHTVEPLDLEPIILSVGSTISISIAIAIAVDVHATFVFGQSVVGP